MSTTFHRYRFDSVTDYLHHRPPYLMVERIVDLADEAIITEKTMTGDEHFSQGHFPGLPIFPGAMMQEFTTQSAGILIAANYNPLAEFDTSDPTANGIALGVLVKVRRASYRGFVRPGDTLQATVTLEDQLSDMFWFRASIAVAGSTVVQNSFQLANVSTSQLRGESATDSTR